MIGFDKKGQKEDCDDLLAVYSDKNACHFLLVIIATEIILLCNERADEALEFWNMSYENGWFARFAIVDKTISKAIGTIELCLRVSEDAFNNMGILRVDVRSDYEREDILYDIIALTMPHISELLGCNGVLTKAPIYAVERIKAIQKAGFVKSEHFLVGHNGYAYDGYWTMK